MSQIKNIVERQFNAEIAPVDTSSGLSVEQIELMKWLEEVYDIAEVLNLISFESVYILKANFGQLLHL
jgi:hypothetical protein